MRWFLLFLALGVIYLVAVTHGVAGVIDGR
jgi:hypothetical protein